MTTTELRKQILTLAYKSKEGHIPSALSILDILYVLYRDVMNIFPYDPENEERDRFILSKGHGCLALYVVLADMGYFSQDVLNTFCQDNSPLLGHPVRNLKLGIEASTGSLGHGLPMAVGMAMALKIKKNPAKVYCLIGDGECNEGSVSEAVVLACEYKLDNLFILLDCNDSSILPIPPFYHMGCEVFNCFAIDIENIKNVVLKAINGTPNRPKVVMLNTVKGRGIKRMEHHPSEWHHKIPTEQEYNEMMEEL
jgi:transketolase